MSPAAELSPALHGALAPALHTIAAARPVAPAPASPVVRKPVRAPPAPSPHLASGIALTLEHAQKLAARPQASAGIALTMDEAAALARHPASHAGLPPPPGTAVAQPPPGNIALGMEHAQRLAAAPEFRQAVALTTADSEALAKSPMARAGIAMTLEESLALAEATQKNAAIALTMDDALALASSPGSRAGLGLYDKSSPDLVTNGRLSPEAVKAALRGEHPVFPLKGEPSGGPRKPQTGQFGKPGVTKLPAALPLRVANALWTSIDVPQGIQISDVAAGTYGVTAPDGGVMWRPAVWAIGKDTSDEELFVYRLVDGGRLEEQTWMPVAEPAPAGRVAAARDTGRPFAFAQDDTVWLSSVSAPDSWQPLVGAYPGIVDMAVGRLADAYNPEIWWVDDGGTLYQVKLEGQAPNLEGVSVPVRGNTSRVSIGADGNLWTVSRDGHLGLGVSFQDLTPPGGAKDVAAVPGGDAYAIGAQRASGITTSAGFVPSAGNKIWFWNHLTKTWSLIPGWGVAIDVDNDGNLWVVDENGKVWNRGGRKFGFWNAGWRQRPAPGQSWCDFEKQVFEEVGAEGEAATQWNQNRQLSQAVSDFVSQGKLPALMQEYVQRFAQGGASTLLLDEYFVPADNFVLGATTPNGLQAVLPLAVAAKLGIDIYLIIPAIMTNRKVVPQPFLYQPFSSPQMQQAFDDFFDALVDSVNELFQALGLAKRFEDVIKYVTIGGEVDAFLRDSPKWPFMYSAVDSWDNWIDFYDHVTHHVRQKVPRVKLGCVLTRPGAASDFFDAGQPRPDPENSHVRRLNKHSDYVAFTTYPPLCMGNNPPSNQVNPWFTKMLAMAADKPVIIQEIGWPTYDKGTCAGISEQEKNQSPPPGFYTDQTDPACPALSIGICQQKGAVDAAFAEWGKENAKLRVPVIIWFTLFEQHVEGDGCTPWADIASCDPCKQPDCHICGLGENVDWLGQQPNERDKRFFGSDGLIRSDGIPKGETNKGEEGAWGDLLTLTAALRVPRGNQ